uniref:Uncharacterized protein n=1 Tax=Fagus sylvatica TaxID=28930 RepID=A0A2N9FQ68_FAGSY
MEPIYSKPIFFTESLLLPLVSCSLPLSHFQHSFLSLALLRHGLTVVASPLARNGQRLEVDFTGSCWVAISPIGSGSRWSHHAWLAVVSNLRWALRWSRWARDLADWIWSLF